MQIYIRLEYSRLRFKALDAKRSTELPMKPFSSTPLRGFCDSLYHAPTISSRFLPPSSLSITRPPSAMGSPRSRPCTNPSSAPRILRLWHDHPACSLPSSTYRHRRSTLSQSLRMHSRACVRACVCVRVCVLLHISEFPVLPERTHPRLWAAQSSPASFSVSPVH